VKYKGKGHTRPPRNIDMNDILVIYSKPLTSHLIACTLADYETQAPELLNQGYIEFSRMSVKEYVELGRK
jgi:hypothetical protein